MTEKQAGQLQASGETEVKGRIHWVASMWEGGRTPGWGGQRRIKDL